MAPPSTTTTHTSLTRERADLCGMAIAVTAREFPERLAIASRHGDRTFDFLNARANQLVGALRARGLGVGDGVALLCANRPEFAVAFYATLRAGMRLTPINTRLTAGEIAYIVEDCRAKALLADGRFAPAAAAAAREVPAASVRLAIGDPIHAFESFEDALGEQSSADILDPCLGSQMLYTSGTTGRPKGVYRAPEAALRQPGLAAAIEALHYAPGNDCHLCTGPLHHAAPLVFSLAMPLNLGCSVVLMDGWDARHALDQIAGYRITHTHMVPTMFRQLLAVPEEERAARDVSSLKAVLHGAAPCPVAVKHHMLEWLGPILHEYYAATEGWGSFVHASEWLAKPGTVGRPVPGEVVIRDEAGSAQPTGEKGLVYLHAPEGAPFEYFGDPDKTRACFADDYFTLWDVGYLDEDGYLFLCDRSADVINRGGVNVYPAEVDAVLVTHPAVADSATIGVPDDELGEIVVSVVELRDGFLGSGDLVEEISDYCRHRLAGFKCPARVEFAEGLPRHETGKIVRRLVRESYRGIQGAAPAGPT